MDCAGSRLDCTSISVSSDYRKYPEKGLLNYIEFTLTL